jgi:Glycosyltransferase sugar-binding region containing DXD motif
MLNKVIQGFWIGDTLTNIQKLSLNSFIHNGHDYHLYTYSDVQGVPSRAQIFDANLIVPLEKRKLFKNDANFSDYFRAKLTYAKGGFYADTDIICLKPFEFEDPWCFVSEYQFGKPEPPPLTKPLVNGCIVKVPAGDKMTGEIIKRIEAMDTRSPELSWIAVGPEQYRWGCKFYNHNGYVQPPEVFDSLWPTALQDFVSLPEWAISDKAHAIHLRTSYWKPGTRLDPNGIYPEDSWFESLKRKYNGNS